MRRVETTRPGLVHCIAACKDCEWTDDNYLAASSEARKHVRETGHTVSVESGRVHEVRVVGGPDD